MIQSESEFARLLSVASLLPNISSSGRFRRTDEDTEEVFGEVVRTRYVVHDDANKTRVRSQEAAAAVAAVNMGRKVSPRAKMSSKPAPTRYTLDEDVEEFPDAGGCSC